MVRACMSIYNLDRGLQIALLHLKIDERVCLKVFMDMSKNEQLGPIFVEEHLKLPEVPKIGPARAAIFTVEWAVCVEHNPLGLCILCFLEVFLEPAEHVYLVFEVLVVEKEIQVY